MALTPRQIREMLELVAATRADEIDCDGCLERLAAFAERSRSGLPGSQADDPVRHHLSICPECAEEFAALLEAGAAD